MTTLPQTAPVRVARPMLPSHLAIPGPAPLAAGGHAHPGQPGTGGGLTAADIWRVVRANLWLIVLMVLAAGIGGYFVNAYLARHYSRYTAVGLMQVNSPAELPQPNSLTIDPRPEAVQLAQNTQANMLRQDGLFIEAVQDKDSKIRQTAWFQAYKDHLDQAKEDMGKNFAANPVPDSKLLRVEMTFSSPEDAKTIVEEMVDKHIEMMTARQRKTETKKLDLLKKEFSLTEVELSEDVIKAIREKELQLGGDQVGTFQNWNGLQLQLDRLLQEKSRIASELAGFESRLDTLKRDLDEGRTPAEVERQINESYRYLNLRQQVDNYDIELDTARRKFGEQSETVIYLSQRRAAYQAKVDECHEELKSTYAETMKAMFENEIAASRANANRIDETIKQNLEKLSNLNRVMQEYRVLQTRERDLRVKMRDLNDQINRIKNFNLGGDWAPAEWAVRPQKPDRPSFPKLPLTMAVALVLGLGLSLGIAFLREMTDTTVRSPRDIARVGQLNLLGMIPHEADDPQAAGGRLQLAIYDAPQSVVAEQFRQLRTRLHHAASLDTNRSLLVTSPSPGDGKSTVACNLAAGLALNGRRILLVDANFRRPLLHSVFATDNETGFATVLEDPDAFADAVRATEVPNLSLLPAGPKPANPAELLESQLLPDFIDRALEEYDHVIFDGGPLLVVSDVVALAPRVDGVVTVVRARGNSRGLLMRMRDELRKIKAEHLGVVLNAVRSQGGGYYGRNIKTYYEYQNA